MFGFTYYCINEDGHCEETVWMRETKKEIFTLFEEIEDEAAHENPPCEIIDPIFFVTYSREEIEKYF